MTNTINNDDLLERILRAPVYDVAVETPLDETTLLSERLGNRVWIKHYTSTSVRVLNPNRLSINNHHILW